MGKLVLDTNALIRSIPKVSPYHDLYLSLFDGRNSLCVSNEMIEEYEEVLERYTNSIIAKSIIEQILNNENTLLITPYFSYNLISADPDDNKFVDCAVCADAKFIVTDDRHFQILKKIEFPKIDIISLVEIMKMI